MKILILGKQNCSACEMAKTVLKNKDIEFEYKLLDELEPIDKKEYTRLAREQGKLSMPLILKDGQLLSLQEVIA